jgi:hypothetical protein
VGGRLTDGDSYAGGSLRVMGTSFGTGHAAGEYRSYKLGCGVFIWMRRSQFAQDAGENQC